MELKKFEAPTLAEALKVVKRELGPEAVILSTKNNKSGFGLLSGTSVEVTATVTPEALERKRAAEARLRPDQRQQLEKRPAQSVVKSYDVLSGSRLGRQIAAAKEMGFSGKLGASATENQQQMAVRAQSAQKAITQRRYVDIEDDESPAEMASAYSNDRARLSQQAMATNNPNFAAQALLRTQHERQDRAQQERQERAPQARQPEQRYQEQSQDRYNEPAVDHRRSSLVEQPQHGYGQQQPQHAYAQQQQQPQSNYGGNQSQAQGMHQQFAQQHLSQRPSTHSGNGQNLLPRIIAQLLDSGIEAELARDLGDELKVIMVREHITREDILKVQMARILMSRLRVAKPLTERLRIPTTPRMITFVGPTGVGKTTTIAKIAAELVISQQRPVTLVTTDTFKIAAVEQLQTYANILRIPLEVCPTAESLEQLQSTLDSEHVVLIDTAGYGPKDERKLNELKETLSSIRTETHLCVGAMIRDRDLAEAVRRFKMFSPDYLVMTKLDETSSFGSIFNISVKSHLPLSYFTMGQRVPEDMEIATKERVADLILNISGGQH